MAKKRQKLRQHKCRSLPKRSKYGVKSTCRSCGYSKRGSFKEFRPCPVCGGQFIHQ